MSPPLSIIFLVVPPNFVVLQDTSVFLVLGLGPLHFLPLPLFPRKSIPPVPVSPLQRAPPLSTRLRSDYSSNPLLARSSPLITPSSSHCPLRTSLPSLRSSPLRPLLRQYGPKRPGRFLTLETRLSLSFGNFPNFVPHCIRLGDRPTEVDDTSLT